MANYYFKTIGEAWAGIANAFTSFGYLTYKHAGFSIVWVPGGGVEGGYLQVAGDVIYGEDFATGRYYAAEAQSGQHIPIRNVMGEPGMWAVIKTRALVADGGMTIAQLVDDLTIGRRECLTNATNAHVPVYTDLNTIFTDGTLPVVQRTIGVLTTITDQAIDMVAVVDMDLMPATSQPTEPYNPTYSTNSNQIVNITVNQGPQYDVNQSINSGGSIYTIGARQISGP